MSLSPVIASAEDFPAAQPQPVKYWSESYAFWAWDEQNDLTLYAHFQRHPDKPRLWRGYVSILRKEVVYAFHSYGAQRSPHGPGFESCFITIEKTHALWRLRVEGAAQRQTSAEHESTTINDGPAVPLSIDVQLSLATPVWSLPHGSGDASTIMPAHYEQTGIASGTIEIGDERFTVNCPGANDHSRGVRNTANLKDGGFFFNAAFPGGRSLTAIKMGAGAEASQFGYICNGDSKIHQATHIVAPSLHWPEVGRQGSFSVETNGLSATVNFTATERRILLTMIPPNYEQIGLTKGYETALYYCDWTCRVEWNGQVGWGSWEISRRGNRL
jgi:hypothetical protein